MNTLDRLTQIEAEEVRMLQEERLRIYRPHEKQDRLHKSQASVRTASGGNQSGKTTLGVVETLWITGKVHPHRENYVGRVTARACCQDNEVLFGVIIPKFQELVPRKPCKLNGLNWPGLRGGTWKSAFQKEPNKMLFLADGSYIEFKTYEQGKKDLQSFAGPPRHFIWSDEEPPLKIDGENVARQATHPINMLYTFTPLGYAQWSYRKLYERAATDSDVEIVFFDTSDNKWVNKATLRKMEELYTDPAERAARLHGQFTYMQGLVFKEYGDHNLIEPYEIPTDGVKYSLVVDPHEQKATAWNIYAEDSNRRIYCIAEGDVEGDIEYISNSIIAQLDGRRMDVELFDPSARRRARIRGHDERMIDEFRVFFPRLIEANNALDVGITRVRSAIRPVTGGKPKFMVSKACPRTDHQFRNYSWKPPLKSGEDRSKAMVSLRENDHVDCSRYRIMHQPKAGGVPIESFGIEIYAN